MPLGDFVLKQTHKTCKPHWTNMNPSVSLGKKKINNYSFGLSHANRLRPLGSPDLLHHIPSWHKV